MACVFFVDGEEPYPPVGSIRQIHFDNIWIDNSQCDKNTAFLITGLPGKSIKDIFLNDIHMIVPGGGTAEDAKTALIEFSKDFFSSFDSFVSPEYGVMGGTVPACGMYLRHIDGLQIRNFNPQKQTADKRDEIVMIDVNK